MVAGNTEVSQAACNALFGALGAIACSQATMNNFLFGDATRQYYETICGGTGAGPGFDGTSAVQSHMTNTRMTDPEVLELRYPVRLEDFSIRHGSGGAGRWHGGDGGSRRIRFLEPMTAVIVASRREVAPFGLDGGADARPAAMGGTRGWRLDTDRDRQSGTVRGGRVRYRDAGRRRLRAAIAGPRRRVPECAREIHIRPSNMPERSEQHSVVFSPRSVFMRYIEIIVMSCYVPAPAGPAAAAPA